MTFQDVIDLWPTARDLGEDLGEKTATVHKWRQRNAIPGDQWLALYHAAKARGYRVSLTSLAQMGAR
jgi:hypothetical protein